MTILTWIILGLVAGWGTNRLIGSGGYGAKDKVMVRVERIKGRSV